MGFLFPRPPRPPQNTPTLDDLPIPTSGEGQRMPILFGTIRIRNPNVIQYTDRNIHTYQADV